MRRIPNFISTYNKLPFFNHLTSMRWQSTKFIPLKFGVPNLDQTLKKYVRFVQPLISESELKHTNELIEKFAHSGGEGEALQKLLIAKADTTDNWLSEWWKTVAYLDSREPIVINSNPGVRFPVKTFSDSDEWINFSAEFLASILKYKLLVDEKNVPQEYMKDDPLCMSQYYTLFSSCRIPGIKKDEIYSARSDQLDVNDRPTYITIVHKNRFFVMDVIDRRTQKIYSKEAIIRGFYKVLEFSKTKGQPIGLMTAENRNVWGKSFTRMLEVSSNKKAFSMMQNSLLLFCLDGPVFTDSVEKNADSLVARNMLHGNGHKCNSANRWFDKTIQVIVSCDGACGMNYEHTTAEAPPLISIIDFVFNDMEKTQGESGNAYQAEICPISELELSLDHQTREDIDVAKTNISSLVSDLELHAISFNEFGKSKIKSQKVSPDAFIQLGIQLGYYNMHSGPGSTYESGSLRRYKLGRTDTIRTCSAEAVAFCKSTKDPAVTGDGRRTLLLAAIEQNSRYAKEVANGQGIDRHLLGLKMVAVENRRNIPEIFMDTSYRKAMHHVLSTSQGASATDLTMCYGPSVPDGYALCYNPRPDKILACVSAIHSSPSTSVPSLSRHVEAAWSSMMQLLSH